MTAVIASTSLGMTTLISPRGSPLHRIHQGLACAQIADDYQIVARRGQSRIAQIFLGGLDRDAGIIGKFYSHRIRPPTKRELPLYFLAGRESENRRTFRTQI